MEKLFRGRKKKGALLSNPLTQCSFVGLVTLQFSLSLFVSSLCSFVYDVPHNANNGGQCVYLDTRRRRRSRARSWFYRHVDTREDYTKTETSEIYQLRTHRRTHWLDARPWKKKKKHANPPREAGKHSHGLADLATWALFQLSSCLGFSLRLNSPRLYLRELAPYVLSFMLKCKQMLLTSKTNWRTFLIDNPALDTAFRNAGGVFLSLRQESRSHPQMFCLASRSRTFAPTGVLFRTEALHF